MNASSCSPAAPNAPHAAPAPFARHGMVALLGEHASPDSNWGVLRVHGADATAFLHAQLSNDVAHMPENAARLAAWCNAKGRMLASFIVVRTQPVDGNSAYWLLCRRDVLEPVIKKLRMYVLRSKVLIEDASQQVAVYGLLGDSALHLWQAHGGATTPQQPWQPWQCLHVHEAGGSRHLVGLYPATMQPGAPADAPLGAMPRLLCLQSAALPAPVQASAQAECLPLAQWEWTEAASGVATIEHACSELFVPQMLNFESVGGVSFKKGCYPGQEVVARSQFRGAIKRRGYIATAHASCLDAVQALAGQEVWWVPTPAAAQSATATPAMDAPESCGTVAQAACWGAHCALFISLQIHAAEAVQAGQGSLHVGSDAGIKLQLHPLPYDFAEV